MLDLLVNEIYLKLNWPRNRQIKLKIRYS